MEFGEPMRDDSAPLYNQASDLDMGGLKLETKSDKRSPRSPVKATRSKIGASKSPRASPRMRSPSPLASARSGGSMTSGMGGYAGNGSRSNLEVVALRGVASHAWHDVPYGEIAPEVVNVVIEIPAGSKVQYAFDKESGMLGVEKILASSILYPHNYGFIPQTLIGDDNQPLAVVVLMQKAVQPMTFLQVRPIGMFSLDNNGLREDKIIAVHVDDPVYREYTDINQLPSHRMAEIRSFFEDYQLNEGKVVKVDEMLGAEAGKELVEFAVNKYIDNFVSKKWRDTYIKNKGAGGETPTAAASPMAGEGEAVQKSKGSFRKAMGALFGSSKKK